MSPADDDKPEGFLSAWSRRKLAAGREKANADTGVDTDDPEAIETEAAGEEPVAVERTSPEDNDDEVDADFIANLPSIDEITAQTDLAPFMRRGVPLALRNSALRKVWLLNPLIRDHVDPALDYAWDWNAPGGVPGGGGTLTGEGVSQMVKNLLGDAKSADDAERTDEAAAIDPEADDAPSAQADTVLPEQPVRQAEPIDREQSTGESADAASPAQKGTEPITETRVNLPLATIRRHGGALPE